MKSIEWAKENIDADLYDVPEDLFQSQLDPRFGESDELDQSAFNIFMALYCIRKAAEGVERVEIMESELIELYEVWQAKLMVRQVSDNVYMYSRSLPAFTFAKDEQVQLFKKPDAPEWDQL